MKVTEVKNKKNTLKTSSHNSREKVLKYSKLNNNILSDRKVDFSIIIPVYNEEKIIGRHLQEYTGELKTKYNFELVLSDGGSVDTTVNICERFADKLIVHDSGYKQNIAQGRNAGAGLADSDILIFINGDTRPESMDTFFEIIDDWAKNDPGTGALACYVSCFKEDAELKDRIFYFLHNRYVQLLNFIGIGMGRGECQIVRKNVFEKVGGYNGKIVAGEDFDLYRRLSKVTKVKFKKQLVVLESPRRFRKYGYLATILLWTLNAFSVLILGRSLSKEWEAVR